MSQPIQNENLPWPMLEECGQLTLLALLKSHQYLGYLPVVDEIPLQVHHYLCQQLNLSPETGFQDAKNTRYRYRGHIRSYLDIKAYSAGGARLARQAAHEAAYTMSDPADLINVAIEHLIEQRFELPAFSTLDRRCTRSSPSSRSSSA